MEKKNSKKMLSLQNSTNLRTVLLPQNVVPTIPEQNIVESSSSTIISTISRIQPSTTETLTLSEKPSIPMKQRELNKMLTKSDVTKAEILWCIQNTMKHNSDRSGEIRKN